MRKSFVSLAVAAALMGAAAAPAAVVNFNYDVADDFTGLSVATGSGSFETIGDDGVFDASGLSAFSLNGAADLVFVFGSYSFGLSDLSAFSATLAGGTLTDLAFIVGSDEVEFTDLLGNPFVTGAVTITTAGLAAGNVTAEITTFGTTTATGDLTASAASGAVPEPASWALMILGFGITGAALRGRRRQATLAV